MSAAASDPGAENVAVREPVAPGSASASSASEPAIDVPPAWLTRVVICAGAVHAPADDDSAPWANTSSSFAFVVDNDGAVTDCPLVVVPLELASMGVVGFTPR